MLIRPISVILILTFCQISSITAVGIDYKIYLRKETINVLGIDSGYVSHVECYGETSAKGGKASVFFNQIEKVTNIKVGYYKNGGRIKNKRRLNKEDLAISSGFYHDSRIYVFDLPEDKQFKYEYTKSSNELFYLSSLQFEVYNADTQIYIIRVPNNLHLKYEIENSNSLLSFEEEKQKSAHVTEYSFKAVCNTNQIRKHKSTQFLTAKVDPFASIRLIITPIDYIGKEDAYFNNWLTELVQPSEPLDSITINSILKTVGSCTDNDSTIQILFNMVKSKIRYVDIEIGIGRFKPHDVNYIYEKKQGDCKDMANLLCQSLRYFDIEANMAISSTISHRLPMDFPSLSSGNHMICVAKDNSNGYLFLDATESEGYYLNPSRQIQGTSIFVVGEGKGLYMDIPIVNASNNKTIIRYNLAFQDNKVAGKYSFEFNAISALLLKKQFNQSSIADFDRYVVNYLDRISPKINYLNYEVNIEDDQLILYGDVEIPISVYTNIGNDNYLLLNFLPFPHPFTDLDDSTAYITYSTLNTELELIFQTDQHIDEVRFMDTQIIEEPINFTLSASNVGKSLYINYEYIYDSLVIEKGFVSKFKAVDKKIKGQFGKAIVFKLQ